MAGILKVDDLRGNTSAGDITITSEGGSATMQLQQGVSKVWLLFNNNGTIIDSFNISSCTDHGTGNWTETYTNNMNNVNYTKLGTSGQAESGGTGMGIVGQNEDNETKTTSAMRMYVLFTNNTTTDRPRNSTSTNGDLA